MVNALVFALAIVSVASACQREIRNREDLQQPTNPTLSPREAIPYPPLWTKEEQILHTSFSNVELDTWSSYYTHGDHIAGRNKSMAEETAKKWIVCGVPASLVEYEVFLNYPKEQALVLKWGNGSHYEAQMYEDVLEVDETTGDKGAVPAFHGYSASGKVEAEYVYVG
jgi:N-acetylated-alpha-linked acidic dipeptidase